MLEYRPYVPITHGVRVGTAILSYNGRLAFGVTGDKDTAPDVGLLATAIATGVDELRQRADISVEVRLRAQASLTTEYQTRSAARTTSWPMRAQRR